MNKFIKRGKEKRVHKHKSVYQTFFLNLMKCVFCGVLISERDNTEASCGVCELLTMPPAEQAE